jgi:competence protein ComEA
MIQRSGIRAALIAALAILSPLAQAQPKPLESIKGCTFIPTEWADGDSFRIQTPDGEEHTIRLYGADCIELHVTTDSDKRRLRDQRRYFGITEAKDTRTESIELAMSLGEKAAEFTAAFLEKPFTIHTRKSSALGDGKFKRIYAFVETEDGKDLATELIRQGLARAFGVSTQGPQGISSERYRDILSDIEFQAAKREKGVWKFTNWDKLPTERETQRIQDEEDEIAQSNTALPADFRINPNHASRDDLEKLPYIGPALAEAIIEEREEFPFEEPKDLMRVHKIKQKTLAKFEKYLDFTIPADPSPTRSR